MTLRPSFSSTAEAKRSISHSGYTGRRTILAVIEAYHGWTVGADAVSSSLGDKPRALETHPDWVRLIASPHTYQGKYRGRESGAANLADMDAQLAIVGDAGAHIVGFIAEPVFRQSWW